MKTVVKMFTFFACLMSFHPAYSLQPMGDTELSEVTGQAGFNQQRILADFARLKYELLQDATDGVQYNGTMTINANGVKTTMAIPSYFKSIHIGEVRLVADHIVFVKES